MRADAATLRLAVFPWSGALADAVLVLGGAGLVALAAQVSIPLPFTPVPITGQTFAVVLDTSLERTLELGLYPFVAGDVLKLYLAGALLPAAWRLVGRS